MRPVTFNVSISDITPRNIMFAGVQGESGATRLEFQLDSKLLEKLMSPGTTCYYRVDTTDGAGGFHSSATIIMPNDTNKLTYELSDEITGTGGECRIFLVFTRMDDGDGTFKVLYSYPAKLWFEGSSYGSDSEALVKRQITEAVVQAENLIREAENLGNDSVIPLTPVTYYKGAKDFTVTVPANFSYIENGKIITEDNKEVELFYSLQYARSGDEIFSYFHKKEDGTYTVLCNDIHPDYYMNKLRKDKTILLGYMRYENSKGWLFCNTVPVYSSCNKIGSGIYPPGSAIGGNLVVSGESIADGAVSESKTNFNSLKVGQECETYYKSLAVGSRSKASGWQTFAMGEDCEASESNSQAFGLETKAKNNGAHAEGRFTEATNFSSHAEGTKSKSAGDSAHAEGNETAASGFGAHSEGDKTKAAAKAAHAEGSGAAASGEASHAEGYNTVASGTYTHAEGSYCTAVGFAAHAEGDHSSANGTAAHAEGAYCAANKNNSHAEGYYTGAYGDYGAHAEGNCTRAMGNESHAEGTYTAANAGFGAHAEGNRTQANGTSSHAEGVFSQANGSDSHAEGYNTRANGAQSHAQGYNAVAQGDCSHASGYNTYANQFNFVVGRYNIQPAAADTAGTAGDLFVVGNGSATGTSNAFRVNAAGGVYAKQTLNATGADVAEFYEWADGNIEGEDRTGLFVTALADKIYPASGSDNYILGVISATPSLVGDAQSEDWQGRYLKDAFGRNLTELKYIEAVTETVNHPDVYETVYHEAETDEEGNVITESYSEQVLVSRAHDEEIITFPARDEIVLAVNPDYDPEEKYIPREKRPEYSPVGILGKLVIIDDGSCTVNGFCYPGENGAGTSSAYGYRVLRRIDGSHVLINFRGSIDGDLAVYLDVQRDIKPGTIEAAGISDSDGKAPGPSGAAFTN